MITPQELSAVSYFLDDTRNSDVKGSYIWFDLDSFGKIPNKNLKGYKKMEEKSVYLKITDDNKVSFAMDKKNATHYIQRVKKDNNSPILYILHENKK